MHDFVRSHGLLVAGVQTPRSQFSGDTSAHNAVTGHTDAFSGIRAMFAVRPATRFESSFVRDYEYASA